MLTITSDLTQEGRDAITEYRSKPENPLKHVFQVGEEIWLRVRIVDPLLAEEATIPLLRRPVAGIEGAEFLGYELMEIGYSGGSGISSIQDMQRELIKFIEEELPRRVKKS